MNNEPAAHMPRLSDERGNSGSYWSGLTCFASFLQGVDGTLLLRSPKTLLGVTNGVALKDFEGPRFSAEDVH